MSCPFHPGLVECDCAVKEEDFSFARQKTVPGDAFGELAIEINNLARALEGRAPGQHRSGQYAQKIMGEAEAAIFTFRPDRRLRCSTAQEGLSDKRKNRSWPHC